MDQLDDGPFRYVAALRNWFESLMQLVEGDRTLALVTLLSARASCSHRTERVYISRFAVLAVINDLLLNSSKKSRPEGSAGCGIVSATAGCVNYYSALNFSFSTRCIPFAPNSGRCDRAFSGASAGFT